MQANAFESLCFLLHESSALSRTDCLRALLAPGCKHMNPSPSVAVTLTGIWKKWFPGQSQAFRGRAVEICCCHLILHQEADHGRAGILKEEAPFRVRSAALSCPSYRWWSLWGLHGALCQILTRGPLGSKNPASASAKMSTSALPCAVPQSSKIAGKGTCCQAISHLRTILWGTRWKQRTDSEKLSSAQLSATTKSWNKRS